MIDRNIITAIVEEWLAGKNYFLVDVTVSADNRIVVEIDHIDGVWIEDCVELSRFIESKLNRDEADYELEVGSAGIGQPFKVLQQYYNHIDKDVEVMLLDGRKMTGVLKDVSETDFCITIQEKVRHEGAKRPKIESKDIVLSYDAIKYTKYLISFK